MKVVMTAGPDAEITVDKTEDGRVVAVNFEPKFSKKNGLAVLAHCQSRNNVGTTLEEFTLTASGSTGRVTKSGRDGPVVAAVDAEN